MWNAISLYFLTLLFSYLFNFLFIHAKIYEKKIIFIKLNNFFQAR